MPAIKTFLFLSLAVLLFVSCNNELDVNATWKETGIVYCLLDKRDSVQYVKVTRAFLNDGANAYDVAKLEDSLYFNDEELTVKIGLGNKMYDLKRIKIDNRDEGIFAAPDGYVYITPKEFKVIDGKTYNLLITNKKTGYTMTSSTTVISDGNILDPYFTSVYTNMATCSGGEFGQYLTRSMRIESGTGAKFYDLEIEFHYTEIDTISNVSTEKSITWTRARLLSTATTLGGQEISTKYKGEEFYKYVASQLSPSDHLIRKIGQLEFRYSSGGNEIYDYINVNTPSIGIVQKKPEYTNVENGLGIFSSKNNQSLFIDLDLCSKQQLVRGVYTGELGFVM